MKMTIYLREDSGAINDDTGCSDYDDPELCALDAIKQLTDWLLKHKTK